MEITLPEGCNLYYGTYIDNYVNNTRSRYYFNNYELVLTNRSNYHDLPSGAVCFEGTLYYKPEVSVYFQAISLAIVGVALALIFNLIIKRCWQGK